MSRLIYVDTNVFVSYLRGEYGNVLTINQEYEGKKLFDRAVACEFTLYISYLVIEEFERITKLSSASIASFFERFRHKNKLAVLEPDDSISKRATEFCRKYRTPFADAIHAAYAEKADAILVTWNMKDFENIAEITALRPNEL